jgi:hypothetical protein
MSIAVLGASARVTKPELCEARMGQEPNGGYRRAAAMLSLPDRTGRDAVGKLPRSA